MQRFLALILIISGAFSTPLLADEPSLKPMTLAYTIKLESKRYGNATLGKIETTLKKTDQGYHVASTTKAEGFSAILIGKNYQESCNFVVNDGRAASQQYSGGRKDLTDYRVDFDWQQRKIDFADGESLDMPQGYILDNCNMLFATSLLNTEEINTESLYIVDGKKKRIRGFKLKSSNPELLETPFGKVETIKVVFERELIPERTISFWLSPKYFNIPMKMEEKRRKRTTTFLIDQLES